MDDENHVMKEVKRKENVWQEVNLIIKITFRRLRVHHCVPSFHDVIYHCYKLLRNGNETSEFHLLSD